MKIIREPQALIGLLEDGEFPASFRDELQETMRLLNDKAGPKGKAKGSVTLKLDIKVEGGIVTISPDLSSKRPKEERRATVMWVLEDGSLSTQHPKQTDMFDGPRAVPNEDRRAAE